MNVTQLQYCQAIGDTSRGGGFARGRGIGLAGFLELLTWNATPGQIQIVAYLGGDKDSKRPGLGMGALTVRAPTPARGTLFANSEKPDNRLVGTSCVLLQGTPGQIYTAWELARSKIPGRVILVLNESDGVTMDGPKPVAKMVPCLLVSLDSWAAQIWENGFILPSGQLVTNRTASKEAYKAAYVAAKKALGFTEDDKVDPNVISEPYDEGVKTGLWLGVAIGAGAGYLAGDTKGAVIGSATGGFLGWSVSKIEQWFLKFTFGGE